jgi:2-methylcitrate dehydratase PrpD
MQTEESGYPEVTRTLAGFISETTYEQLPTLISDRIKKSILDTIGVIIPASVLMPGIKASPSRQDRSPQRMWNARSRGSRIWRRSLTSGRFCVCRVNR